MKRFLTPQTVINDIQFELLQGTISRDQLGRSIQMVRKYTNQLREQHFSPDARTDEKELISRQFQLIDMLLTLIQEISSEHRATRLELHNLSEMIREAKASKHVAEQASDQQRAFTDTWLTSELSPYLENWPPEDIEEAIEEEALSPEIVLTPPRIPIIGKLISRFRLAIHNVAIFYVAQLGDRQSKINATYGHWIERLIRHGHEQQEKIRVLTEKVEALEQQQIS